jgi:hypothetical protein
MIILLQAGLYDIVKKEPAQIIDDYTIQYQGFLFSTFRLDENIKNLLANNCKTKKEQLRAVAFWIVEKQLNNLSLNYIIDFPLFTIDELDSAITYIIDNHKIDFHKIVYTSLSVNKKIYKNVLDILEKNKFEYINNFKKEAAAGGAYKDLDANLYDVIINRKIFKQAQNILNIY